MNRVFFALRDVHLDSGVSPILSVLLFAAGFFSLGCFGLRWLNLRQRLRGSHLIKLSNRPEQSIWGQRLKVILDRSESGVLLANPLVTGSRLWASRALVIIVLVVLVLASHEIYHRSVNTLEQPIFELAFALVFIVYLLSLAWLLAWFAFLWRDLSSLFRQVAQLPLLAALERLPKRARLLFGRFIRTDPDLDAGWEMFEQAAGQLPAVGTTWEETCHRLEHALPELAGWWHDLPVARAFDLPPSGSKGEDQRGGETASESDNQRRRMEAVEDALSLFLVLRLRPYAIALRWLAVELTIGPLLLLLAATCFPYQPQQFTATLVWAFIVLALATILMTYVRVDRDEFVSRVAQTEANKVTKDWAFVSNILNRLVPALTVFLIAFPGISYWLRSVLEPLSRAIK